MRSRLNPGSLHPHISRLSYWRALFAIFACFALSVLMRAQESTVTQEPTQHRTTARHSSTARAEKRTDKASSVPCAPGSNGVLTPPTTTKDVSTTTEKSAASASTTTATPEDSSKNGWISDQTRRNEQTNSSQLPRSDEPANSSAGSDRQCTPPQGDSLKTALDNPN
jgi:hypothetical protein